MEWDARRKVDARYPFCSFKRQIPLGAGKLHGSGDIRGDSSTRERIRVELSGRAFQQETTAWLPKAPHQDVRRIFAQRTGSEKGANAS